MAEEEAKRREFGKLKATSHATSAKGAEGGTMHTLLAQPLGLLALIVGYVGVSSPSMLGSLVDGYKTFELAVLRTTVLPLLMTSSAHLPKNVAELDSFLSDFKWSEDNAHLLGGDQHSYSLLLSSSRAPIVAISIFAIVIKLLLQPIFLKYPLPKALHDGLVLPVMAAHNLFLSVASFVMHMGLLQAVVGQGRQLVSLSGGQLKQPAALSDLFDALVCDPSSSGFDGPISFWLYIFFLSKFYEFLDTMFLAIRGRDISFLHFYHHIITLSVSWLGLHDRNTAMWIAAFTNTFVHVLMYSYYFVKDGLGVRRIWWKSSLTSLQMFQFCLSIALLNYLLLSKVLYGRQCQGEVWANVVCQLMNVSFFVLFKQYGQTRKKTLELRQKKKKQM